MTKCIKKLDGEHGIQDPLTVAQEKVHEYLGIAIDFGLKFGVAFSQHDFIKKFWLELRPELRGPHLNNAVP